MKVNLPDNHVEFRSEQTREIWLVSALEVGHAAAEAGRVRPLTDELLRDIAARGRKLVDARQNSR